MRKPARYEARPAPDPPGPWCVWDLLADARAPKADKVLPMSFASQEDADTAAQKMNSNHHAPKYVSP